MKYKAISAAIHNLGHSFTSLMNYVDDNYIVDDLAKLRLIRISRNGVEPTALRSLSFCWPAKGKKFMVALDDREKQHKIFVNERK